MSGKNQILKSAGAMGAATLMSRILGLVREQTFAYFFGASLAMDAFNIAFRIPNLLRDLFAEGAMSAALVPTFVQTRDKQGERRAWRLAGLVFRVLLIVVSVISAIGIVFAPEIVGLYASAFREVPGKFELTVQLTRIMFPFFPLVALAAAFMAVLNACGMFFLPAFASALFNATSIGVGVALTVGMSSWGYHPIEGMAWGVVAGGMVQALCQLPALYRRGYRWPSKTAQDPAWHQDPGLRRILFLMLPGTLGLAATQINILVNSILASGLGTGAVSWLNYAFRLMQFPIGIFGVSLAAATLPIVAGHWARGEWPAFQGALQRSVRQVLAINLPAAAGLGFLGAPIIQLIFEYGSFTAADTAFTASALASYSVGLAAYSLVKVLVPVTYAMGRARVAVQSSVLSVAVNLGLNLLLVGPLGHWGLALGTSLTALLNAGYLMVVICSDLQKHGVLSPWRGLAQPIFMHSAVALAMGGLCWGAHYGILQWLGPAEAVFERLIRIGFLMGIGVGFLLLSAKILKLDDTVEMSQLVWDKLLGKFRTRWKGRR